MNIRDALRNTNPNQLGSTTGLYLCKDKVNGWSVVHLNCFQKILRCISQLFIFRHLGWFYSNTLLDQVAYYVAFDQDVDVHGELFRRMRGLWENHFPNVNNVFISRINSDRIDRRNKARKAGQEAGMVLFNQLKHQAAAIGPQEGHRQKDETTKRVTLETLLRLEQAAGLPNLQMIEVENGLYHDQGPAALIPDR